MAAHRRLLAALAALVLVVTGCSSSDSGDAVAERSSDGSTTDSTEVVAEPDQAGDGSETTDAGDPDSPCDRFAASVPVEGEWVTQFADPTAEQRGYDNTAPMGDVNYDRGVACTLSNGGTAAIAVSAGRIVSPAEWEATIAYRTGEAGCHTVDAAPGLGRAYLCPPGDRSSRPTLVGEGTGAAAEWVLQVEFADFDGATNEINRDIGPVTNPENPTDDEAAAVAGAWADALGDPAAYDLGTPAELPTPTTQPTPTTRATPTTAP